MFLKGFSKKLSIGWKHDSVFYQLFNANKNKSHKYLMNLAKTAAIILAALLAFSCGGGGGGGGMVAFSPSEDGSIKMHNGGDAGGWGKGNETGGGYNGQLGNINQYEEDSLFNIFPYFFSPIQTVDLSLNWNEKPVEGLTGLTAATKKEILPEFKIGDKISGTARITLANGTVREAVLDTTEVNINTKLVFHTDFIYKIQGTSGVASPEGVFRTTTGIDVSNYISGALYGYGDSTVSAFTDGKDTYPVTGGWIYSPMPGDKVLTPVFKCEPELSIAGTGVTPLTGEDDSYVYDYAQNPNGVSMTIQPPSVSGVAMQFTVDGTAHTLHNGDNPYNMNLLHGEHVITMNVSGGSNSVAQTITKNVTVYVKPNLKISGVGTSSSGARYLHSSSVSGDTYKCSYLSYRGNMPVTGLVAEPSGITVTEAYLDGSQITGSSTASLGNHNLTAAVSGSFCVQPDAKPIKVEIKPVKVSIGTITANQTDNDGGSTVDLTGTLYACTTNSGQVPLMSWNNDSVNKNNVSVTPYSHDLYLNAPSDNFYFYTSKMVDEDSGPFNGDDDMGTVGQGDGNSTRSLSNLVSNTAFSVSANGPDGHISYSFSVSLSEP
ncbi:MAG: hypothetical protein PUF61_11375 [Spirochaetales bacterium]|nr:hypothetical protein [Spirochaetales bacterium]